MGFGSPRAAAAIQGSPPAAGYAFAESLRRRVVVVVFALTLLLRRGAPLRNLGIGPPGDLPSRQWAVEIKTSS